MTSTDKNSQYYGSILIIEFENQQAAEDWFHQEPYYMAGVYARVTIKPYIYQRNFHRIILTIVDLPFF